MTANQINFFKAKEEAKHWDRMDTETQRHNFQNEAISWESNAIQNWWNQQQAAHLIRQDQINQEHYERQDYLTAYEIDNVKVPNVKINQQEADTRTLEHDLKERQFDVDIQKYNFEAPYKTQLWESENALNISESELNYWKSYELRSKAVADNASAFRNIVTPILDTVRTGLSIITGG